MRTWIGLLLLCCVIGVPVLRAQVEQPAARASSEPAEESVDSNEPADPSGAVTRSTTTTAVIVMSTSEGEAGVDTQPASLPPPPPPAWIHLVRPAAMAGPIAFLLLAWAIGMFLHLRLVRGEQAEFPASRGSRAPQTMPMLVSAALFFVPVVLFLLFEIRSRQELHLGIGGVNDEWQPVTAQAWTALLVCLVLALVPWLFARPADRVAEGRS